MDFLRLCHDLPSNSKESQYLFSPALFDPALSQETHRGNANIAYLRHVILDFENGELKPDGIPNLLPATRMIVTNTFNHTTQRPRFRVILPTTENMTPEVYRFIVQDCIAVKLEEAGYSVNRGRQKTQRSTNLPRSGLDWSKTSPHSIFYLPCQAKNPADSFFKVYFDPPRQPLNPTLWLQNTVIPLQPESDSLLLENRPSGINEALIERATAIWRSSKEYPGQGDAMFFNFALALRRECMGDREEASFGSTIWPVTL